MIVKLRQGLPCHARLLTALLAMFAMSLGGCSEKKTAQGTSSKQPQTDTDGATDDSADDESSDGFDLCKDGLQKKSISGFSSYITALCEGSKPKVTSLRDADAIYTGGDPKIYKDNTQKGATETSVRIYTSTVVAAAVDDYWALLQLQLKNAKVYKDNYDYDASATLSEVKVDGTDVSFRYAYDAGNGGNADYTATTKFITLKAGQAYVTATDLDKTYETMKSLTGLIIINKKSDTKTEVFTMSDQTYTHADGQGETVESSAISNAEAEQKRMYQNAKTADKAVGLLKE